MRALVASVSTVCLLVVAAAGCATRVARTEPAPSATVVTAAPGTTVVTAPAAAVPYCGGAWTPVGGTNFGACPK